MTFNDKRHTLLCMIKSFRCKDSQALYETGKTRRLSAIKAASERKLIMLESSEVLDDLKSLPGNRLEPLEGDPQRSAQHPHIQAVVRVFSMDGGWP